MTSKTYSTTHLYRAIATAETGGELNPWIRTRVRPAGGSTAYGPVQLTLTKAQDYFIRHNKRLNVFAMFFVKFHDQACKFIKYGGKPNLPMELKRYDYGGCGDLAGNDKHNYKRFCESIIDIDYKLADYDLDQFITRWRGVPENQDPVYFKKVKDELSMLLDA